MHACMYGGDTYVSEYIYIYTDICFSCVYTYIYTYIHIYIDTYTHIYIYTYINIYIYGGDTIGGGLPAAGRDHIFLMIFPSFLLVFLLFSFWFLIVFRWCSKSFSVFPWFSFTFPMVFAEKCGSFPLHSGTRRCQISSTNGTLRATSGTPDAARLWPGSADGSKQLEW